MTAARLTMLVVLMHSRAGKLPYFTADDWLVVILDANERNLPFVGALIVAEIIGGVAFLLNQIADIFFVFQNSDNGIGTPF